jgi:hypothetical protein
MELCGPITEILEAMLAFVHDRRVTSTNVLLHPYLRDVRAASFTALYAAAATQLVFTGELDHFSVRFNPL